MTAVRNAEHLVGLAREVFTMSHETERLECRGTVGTRSPTYLPHCAAPRARPGEIA